MLTSGIERTAARRDVLRGGAGLALLGAARPALARGRTPLGLVEITLTRQLAQDYAGTLRQLAGMGYTHFGFRMAAGGAGANQPSSANKARMVRDAGLQVGMARFGLSPQTYDRDIADAAAIGAKGIVLSAAPVFSSRKGLGVATRAEFEAWLPQLAALAVRCRAAGLNCVYHNHWWDVMPLEGGEAPLDTIAQAIPPGDLAFEVDLAWAWYGGVAPLDLLSRLGPRVVSMHFKDIDRSRFKPLAPGAGLAEQSASITGQAVVIGRGEMGYAALLPRIRRLTSAVGYVEVDMPADGLAAAADGARFFREHQR